MPILTATFEIDLSQGYFISCGLSTDPHECNGKINGLDVQVILNPGFRANRSAGITQNKSDPSHQIHLSRFCVAVSRDEPDLPPPSHSERIEYFEKRAGDFREVARAAFNRLVAYFSYKLGNPNLKPLPEFHSQLMNPKWSNSEGKMYSYNRLTIMLDRMLPLGTFGMARLEKLSDLDNVLGQQPYSPCLHEEFLLNARNAIIGNQYRRAVLELAIVCEIMVKNKFASKKSPAFDAYVFLDGKRLINAPITKLVSGIAEEPCFFGRSFQKDHPDQHIEIDYLFRCRNKIAHKGEMLYNDTSGNSQKVDLPTISRWWDAVEVLLKWLGSLP